ncbi:MAG: hypothetical protein KC483_09080 [Nitrosarchaeum sp.]|nr:hypothetical protein [Nitrosarchaeum sp.]MCA9820664.1 hypothetical protein [Nitrosarchaeum sp.]
MSLNELNYKISDSSKHVLKELDNKLFGSDIILILLSIGDIKGETILQKQVFLTWKEVYQNETADLGYFPYRYGAYSRIIRDSCKILEKNNLVKVIKRKGEGSIFKITSDGMKVINEKILRLNLDLEKLKNNKENWDEWTREGTLRYVYRNYPEYTTETRVKRLKW